MLVAFMTMRMRVYKSNLRYLTAHLKAEKNDVVLRFYFLFLVVCLYIILSVCLSARSLQATVFGLGT